MLFNSLDFAIFLPIVFAIYWLLSSSLKLQNLLVVIASYLFYGLWDWRFLTLIIFSTILDFLVGKTLAKEKKVSKRKMLLFTSITINLGFLAFFKYYNFFLDSFVDAFSFFHHPIQVSSLNIILPVGISFYTFQTLSYTIDIYNKKLEPSTDIVAFSAFVSFFPQLVAGPIERASNLLPQFSKKRKFSYENSVVGMKQILWGLFKKVVIADNCAEFVNQIFNNYENLNGSTLVLGAVFFSFQIYGDFSGYSDIAIGTSKLFGFNLKRNFANPYFSRDIAEFWRRWHISLSTWFRDYLYIPLGGNKGNLINRIKNTFIIFLVSGFWHGPNWTFVFWGLLNAVYFLPLLLSGNNRKNTNIVAETSNFPSIRELLAMTGTFSLISFAWIFFRAESLTQAFDYIYNIFNTSLFQIPKFAKMHDALIVLSLVGLFIAMEWIGRKSEFAIESIFKRKHVFFRLLFYNILVSIIIYFGNFASNQFIYFQF